MTPEALSGTDSSRRSQPVEAGVEEEEPPVVRAHPSMLDDGEVVQARTQLVLAILPFALVRFDVGKGHEVEPPCERRRGYQAQPRDRKRHHDQQSSHAWTVAGSWEGMVARTLRFPGRSESTVGRDRQSVTSYVVKGYEPQGSRPGF